MRVEEVLITSRLFKQFIAGLAVTLGLFAGSAHADSAWNGTTFSGSQVSAVAVNPYQQDEVLAVVNGRTKLTLDGGILWRDSGLPVPATMFSFDPVHPDIMYAGTQRGIYRSSDLGMSWQIFGNEQTQVLNVTGLAINSDAIFTTESAGSGTAAQVFRIDRSGVTMTLPFPGQSAGSLVADQGSGAIYAGTRDAIYRSADSGASWQGIAGLGQIGYGTNKLVLNSGRIWQSSPDGIYASSDMSGSSWKQEAGYPAVIYFYPGYSSYPFGLVVNHGNVYFGIKSPWFRIHEVVEVSGGTATRLDFPDNPNDMASGNGRLWVAGDSGLWQRGGLVSNEANIKRPVVVVPGVMGSWQVLGKWKLDPILHTYDPLMKALKDAGYEKDKTLFDFPYEWRQDNAVSGQQLKLKLADIRQICACNKIDIIGHSMGGLVARSYIESDSYAGDVANLIELGTPNAGSVEDYSLWEAGVSVDQDIRVKILLRLFNVEAFENSYPTLTEYIHNHIDSVRQLLPVFDYIEGRHYPDGYPRNDYLAFLNNTANLARLKSRVGFYLVGSESKKTLTGLTLGDKGTGLNWQHGEIKSKTYGVGDGTVPINSLNSIALPNLLINETHGGLAANPSPLWMDYLLGDLIKSNNQAASTINKFLVIYVKSPVRISLTDPVGHKINDTANEINQAFYTGSDSIVQFITIPNPIAGTYTIKLLGKGSGSYSVGVSIISDDPGRDQGVEKTGVTSMAQNDTYTYEMATNQMVMTETTAKTVSTNIDSVAKTAFIADSKSSNQAQEASYTPSIDPVAQSVVANLASQENPATIDSHAEAKLKQADQRFGLFTLMLSAIIGLTLWLLLKLKRAF